MIADEKFFAWLDGELDEAEAAEVEASVASDPELAALAEQHRAMQSRLRGAFDSVESAPVPDRLRAALEPREAEVVDLAEWRARRIPSLPQWAAIAATLALGMFIGTYMAQPAGAPVEVRKGQIYASGDLGRALDVELASAPSRAAVRIGLTFRDRSGDVCRTFTSPAATGLACHDNKGWRVQGLFPSGEGQSQSYRMAAGMDPNLAALLDSAMTGDPMDSEQERAARDKGWR